VEEWAFGECCVGREEGALLYASPCLEFRVGCVCVCGRSVVRGFEGVFALVVLSLCGVVLLHSFGV